MDKNIKLIGISGSLRKGSYNTLTLLNAKELLPNNASLEVVDISGLPIYNEDLEALGTPEIVNNFVKKLEEADGFVISTPEHNLSVSAALKNALDWVSRAQSRPLSGKPVAVMSASVGVFGGIRGQSHLRQILLILNPIIINGPEVAIMSAQNRFDQNGKLNDDFSKKLISDLMKNLVSTLK